MLQPPTPSPTPGPATSAEDVHAQLAGESGLPLDHASFADWRLVKEIGHGAFSKVYLAARRTDGPSCVLKVVNLGPQCKIREDYKPILRAEGHFLRHFEQPGFVQCYNSWGGKLKHSCALPPPMLCAPTTRFRCFLVPSSHPPFAALPQQAPSRRSRC